MSRIQSTTTVLGRQDPPVLVDEDAPAAAPRQGKAKDTAAVQPVESNEETP